MCAISKKRKKTRKKEKKTILTNTAYSRTFFINPKIEIVYLFVFDV
nr:MAG TPA: hypothetical protein [Caudoviricetes sp.]